jgi:hypothetical protein
MQSVRWSQEMNTAGIDMSLWALSAIGNVAVLCVLIYRRLYKMFPIFTAYFVYSCLSDLAYFLIFRPLSRNGYFVAYFVVHVPELALQLGILLEVARNVLVPVKKSLPRAAMLVFGVMLISGTILALVLSIHSNPEQLTVWSQTFVQINFTFGLLRLIIFLAIVCFSQMLGIGWRNHVLQIATGFAGYSVVILLVELLHHFVGVSDPYRYHQHEQIRIVGWCVAIGYWSFFLAKKEAARKEFSPKMANFLISIAAVAKENRAAVSRMYRK